MYSIHALIITNLSNLYITLQWVNWIQKSQIGIDYWYWKDRTIVNWNN